MYPLCGIFPAKDSRHKRVLISVHAQNTSAIRQTCGGTNVCVRTKRLAARVRSMHCDILADVSVSGAKDTCRTWADGAGTAIASSMHCDILADVSVSGAKDTCRTWADGAGTAIASSWTVWESNPDGSEVFLIRRGRPWGPPSLRVPPEGGGQSGRDVALTTPPSSARLKKE